METLGFHLLVYHKRHYRNTAEQQDPIDTVSQVYGKGTQSSCPLYTAILRVFSYMQAHPNAILLDFVGASLSKYN